VGSVTALVTAGDVDVVLNVAVPIVLVASGEVLLVSDGPCSSDQQLTCISLESILTAGGVRPPREGAVRALRVSNAHHQ
jgi:hypothetical protein